MSVPVVAFCNNKGGVGKTSLVYHLSWMCEEMEYRCLAADLDPQSNLTSAFLDEDRLETLWPESRPHKTIYRSLQPLIEGTGDIEQPRVISISEDLGLVAGDLALSKFEDELADAWGQCAQGKLKGFRIMSAFWRVLQTAANKIDARIVLVDLGPSLGALNRAALIAADAVVIPLAPDLFSLQGLRNLGPTMAEWRRQWKKRLDEQPDADFKVPKGLMHPIGYVLQQHQVRLDRPVKAYDKWAARIPETYRRYVLEDGETLFSDTDEHRLGLIKHFHSLMPLAQEAHKPIFRLKAADGAIGAHYHATREARKMYEALFERLLTALFEVVD